MCACLCLRVCVCVCARAYVCVCVFFCLFVCFFFLGGGGGAQTGEGIVIRAERFYLWYSVISTDVDVGY